MDPYTLYQILYGAGAASLAGGAGAAAYGTYRAAKGAYNLLGRKRRAPSGSMGTRYMLKGCRKTRSRIKSNVKQNSITAPASRVIDTKFIDQLGTITGLKNSAPAGNIVGDIAGGSGEGQRVGNDIRIIRVLVSLRLKHGSEVTDQTYRLIVFRYKVGNSGTQPAITDLLDNDSTGNVTPVSFRKVGSLEDYEILLDKTLVIKNQTGSTNHSVLVRNFQIDTCFPQRFSGTGTGTIIRNPMFYSIVTDAPNTTTGASGQIAFRIMFSDI